MSLSTKSQRRKISEGVNRLHKSLMDGYKLFIVPDYMGMLNVSVCRAQANVNGTLKVTIYVQSRLRLTWFASRFCFSCWLKLSLLWHLQTFVAVFEAISVGHRGKKESCSSKHIC